MALCDKWVALKAIEFVLCVACVVAKRVSADDEARLALLLQKQSREWQLLTSVTWGSVGTSFADGVYGGYTIITLGLLVARIVQEVPRGRRILETILLGFGIIFFIVLGGLELSSLESIPKRLTTNALVLGILSLIIAALFLIDLMGPRVYTSNKYTQTVNNQQNPIAITIEKKAPTHAEPYKNGTLANDKTKTNNKDKSVPKEKPKSLDLKKAAATEPVKKEESSLFDSPNSVYSKYDYNIERDELVQSKFGSLRNEFEGGNYVRLSDPVGLPDKLHYEQELARFNEKYIQNYMEFYESKKMISTKQDYIPEPRTPVFSKVKSNRFKEMYDEVLAESQEHIKRSHSPPVPTAKVPTLQQLEIYLKGFSRTKRADTPGLFPMQPIDERDGAEVNGRASGTPTDPGYVQYTARKWPEKRDLRTPRHSPT